MGAYGCQWVRGIGWGGETHALDVCFSIACACSGLRLLLVAFARSGLPCCWLRLVVLAFGFSFAFGCFALLAAPVVTGVYYYVLFILQHTYPISYVHMLFCYMPTIEYI